MGTMRKWYDGYLFGNKEVYNPWRVVHFTEKIVSNENAFPTPNRCLEQYKLQPY